MRTINLSLLNPRHRRIRWPLKSVFLGVVLLFVLYPNPLFLIRHVRNWSDLGAMVAPEEPMLRPLVAEVEQRLAERSIMAGDAKEVLRVVEETVYERIRYAWDWETWGCADYLPTAAETIARGYEDCDGRAVVAASILRKLGHEAQLVTDGSHMWVWTSAGQAMSPMETASGRKLVTTSSEGTSFDPFALIGVRAALIDWPKNLGFGAAVFPPIRLGAIGLAVLLCWWPPRPSWARVFASVGFAAGALIAWRMACSDPWNNSLPGAWSGIASGMLGIIAAAAPYRRNAPVDKGEPANI